MNALKPRPERRLSFDRYWRMRNMRHFNALGVAILVAIASLLTYYPGD